MATYTVKAGDTLGALAKQFGTTVNALATSNNISNPDLIKVGQTINYGAPPTPSLSPVPIPSPYVAPNVNQTSTPSTTYKPSVPTPSPAPIPYNFSPVPANSNNSIIGSNPSMGIQTTTPATNLQNAGPIPPTPSNSLLSSITRNLAPGAQGDDVKALQNYLIAQGYNISAGATGYYGDQTKAAVAAWQKANGMTVDPSEAGYFGPKSKAMLGGVSPSGSTGGTPAVPSTANGYTPPAGDATGAFGGDTSGQYNGYTPPPQAPVSPAATGDANVTDNELLKNILQSMQPTSTELGLQNKMANLEASRKLSYQDIEGNPIATPFQTGQEAAIDKSVNNSEQTVTGQLNIEQAKRQAAIDANKTALDYSLQKQNIQKPFGVSLGSAVYDPKTGQTSGGLYDGQNGKIISQAIQEGRLTPDMITRYGAQAILTTLQSNPDYNFVTGQAGKAFTTNVDTQKFIANSNTALNTINDPNQGIIALSNKVNRGNITLLNNGQLAVKAGISDPATAQFVQQANILADEVSKLLGSGQGSDFAIQLGQTLVNPNYSQATFNATMQNLAGRIQNKVKEYQAQGAQGNQAGGGTSGGTFSGSAWQ